MSIPTVLPFTEVTAPLVRLQDEQWQEWEAALDDLHFLLYSGRLRGHIDKVVYMEWMIVS